MKFKHLINRSIIFSASNSFNLTNDPQSVFSVPPQKQPMRKMNTGLKFVMHSNKASYATKALYDEAMKVGQSQI